VTAVVDKVGPAVELMFQNCNQSDPEVFNPFFRQFFGSEFTPRTSRFNVELAPALLLVPMVAFSPIPTWLMARIRCDVEGWTHLKGKVLGEDPQRIATQLVTKGKS